MCVWEGDYHIDGQRNCDIIHVHANVLHVLSIDVCGCGLHVEKVRKLNHENYF